LKGLFVSGISFTIFKFPSLILEQDISITWQTTCRKRDVRGSVHHSIIHKENPKRCNSSSKCIIPYLYEAQHVSGDTPPIIRSIKLH